MYPRIRPLLAIAALSLLPAGAFAETIGGYVFTKVVDGDTARPDGLGNFYLGFPSVSPALDGNTVLFQDLANSDNSLWTAGAVTGSGFVKLADYRTAVPGGVGPFTRFDDQTARVQGGTVIFEGLDSNTAVQTHGGLYTVPSGGGAPSKIIDYHTTAPESGFPFVQPNGNNQITQSGVSDYDVENGLVAFHAITNGDSQGDNADGIYTVGLDGTGLTLLANRANNGTPPPFPANQYYTATLHGGTAVFFGATVFGGYGIFSSPVTGGLTSPTLLATPSTALPGGQSPEQSTVYFAGFSRFDHTTGNLIFAAHDGSGVNGLYSLPANGLGSGTFSKVVDNHTALPGLPVPASYFDGAPFSADGGQVAFLTPQNESASQIQTLYLANSDGTFSRVVGVGDVLDGITLTGLTLSAHALSGGRVVFGAGSYLQGHDSARYGAIFVATPVAQTSDLALSLDASVDQIAVGSTITYALTVVNHGPAASPSFTLVDTLPAGEAFVGGTTGASVSGNVVTFTGGPLEVGASALVQIVVRATAGGPLVNSATVTGSSADADTSNNTAQNSLVATASQPVATLVATIPNVTSGTDNFAEFTVSLSPTSTADTVINFTIKGTAVNGTDYTLLNTTKKIKAGKTSKNIKIKPLGDLGGASKKTVKLTLAPGTGYTVGTTEQGEGQDSRAGELIQLL